MSHVKALIVMYLEVCDSTLILETRSLQLPLIPVFDKLTLCNLRES